MRTPWSAIAISSAVSHSGSARLFGEQAIALAHRRFIARRIMAVARIEREHQPIQKPAPLPRRIAEKPILRGRQPDQRQPFAKRHRAGRGTIDPHHAALRRGRKRTRAKLHIAQPRANTEPARAVLARHIAKRNAPKPAPRREQRYRLKRVGLPRAIIARQHHESRPRRR